MSRKNLFNHLDDSVRWTGIPTLVAGRQRRRPLRWPATIALALAFGGYAAILVDRAAYAIGFGVLIAGFMVAILVQALGPLKPIGSIEPADEWDRATRDRSFVFAYTLIKITLPLALILIGGVGSVLAGWDLARLQQAIVALGFLMMAIFSALPSAHASWTVRWQREDDPAG